MKALLLGIGALAATFSLVIGLNGALAANQAAATGAKLAVASSGLGRVLVDGRGHTLYLFAKDSRGKSSCTAQCPTFWPPMISSGKPRAAGGAKASLLGTTRRADGRVQVTYNHHPLYTFVKDAKRGQTNGEEVNAFGAEWYAVSAAGAEVEKADAGSSRASEPAQGGYEPAPGYGY